MSFVSDTKTNTTLKLFNREYNQTKSHKYSIDLLRSRYDFANNLYQKDLYSHYGCVNAIEFSDNGQWLVSGGDDRRILLWDVQKAISGIGEPMMMKGQHNSNIFCLGFDSKCVRLFSAGNDELVMIHDSQTGETVDVILHSDAIYGLSVDPIDDNVFASACDDGRVCLWDIRSLTREPFVLARYSTAFHAVMYNPFESRLIATANTKEGIALWDVRKPRCVLQQYNSSLLSSQSAMSVRFNKDGTLILALRRRLPPVLYNLKSSYPIVEFDNSGYYNSCTMKSCSFGGDSDQYILSGSDDFKLYMWKIPDQIYDSNSTENESTIWVEDADLVLSGHRSIVNQVRYNYANSIIASSGVEKVIKFWSTFPLPYGRGGLENGSMQRDNRKVFSHEDYINLVLESGQFVTHDYSHQSVQEDSRMMAFFDSLVQRDIEGWTSDSSDSVDGGSSFYELCWNAPFHTDDSNNSDSTSSAHNSDNEELQQSLNNHFISYLDIISKRIDSSINRQYINVGVNDIIDCPSTSSTINPIASLIKDNLIDNNSQQKDYSKEMGVNRISKLITNKKRDQLKKIAKFTVRATRKKLKRIQRLCNKTNGAVNSDANKRIETLKAKLDILAQQVNFDSPNTDHKPERNSSRRNYRRLRFLTNQSDLVFNEVLPTVSSSSSSDSDDSNFVSGDEVYPTMTDVQRVRNMFPIDTENDNTSDDSSDSFELINSQEFPKKHKLSSSSDDETEHKECAPDINTNNTSNISNINSSETSVDLALKQRNVNKVNNSRLKLVDSSFVSSSHYDDSDSDSGNQTNIVHEPLIHCPYKHNLCHASASASASTSSASNDVKKSSIVFKPIDTRKRSYRKRKRSESSALDKCDKDSDTNNSNNNNNNNNTTSTSNNNNNSSETNNSGA